MSSLQVFVFDADLNLNSEDGFEMVKDLRTNIKQNFKMLLLTSPGEVAMDTNFGVGIKRFLFEVAADEVFSEIDSKIREQVSRYLPYIKIQKLSFNSVDMDRNRLSLIIRYSIPSVSLNDVLAVEVL